MTTQPPPVPDFFGLDCVNRWWGNDDKCGRAPGQEHAFQHRMRACQIELIEHYLPQMDAEAKRYAKRSLACLNGRRRYWDHAR